MSATSSHRRFALLMRSVLRNFAPAVALVAVLAAGAAAQDYIATNGPGPALGLNLSGGVRAEDSPAAFRDAAKTWGMYRIAVIQAATGHPQDAKHTLWQIDQGPPCCPAEVTGVWFCWGMPMYDHPPMSTGWARCDFDHVAQPPSAVQNFPAQPGATVRNSPTQPRAAVPQAAPPGLPANYLAADPRHGPVVDFTDDRDPRGTRITSRKYADGYVVIETPRAEGLASK